MEEQFNFMRAATGLDYGLVETMLISGTSPNFYWTAQKATPLHWVIDSEIDWNEPNPNPDGRMVELLLRYGAYPNLPDADNETPLDWALSGGGSKIHPVHPPAYRLLVERGGVLGKDLHKLSIPEVPTFFPPD